MKAFWRVLLLVSIFAVFVSIINLLMGNNNSDSTTPENNLLSIVGSLVIFGALAYVSAKKLKTHDSNDDDKRNTSSNKS